MRKIKQMTVSTDKGIFFRAFCTCVNLDEELYDAVSMSKLLILAITKFDFSHR